MQKKKKKKGGGGQCSSSLQTCSSFRARYMTSMHPLGLLGSKHQKHGWGVAPFDLNEWQRSREARNGAGLHRDNQNGNNTHKASWYVNSF